MRIIPILLALICSISACDAEESLSSTSNSNEIQHVSNTPLNEAGIEVIGRALRDELEKTYVDADLKHATPIQGSKILKEVVLRYINVGTSFYYAENLLRNARIGIDTDPEHVPSRANEHHGNVVAILELESFWLGGNTNVAIYLYPQNSDDFTVIGRVDVRFFSFP